MHFMTLQQMRMEAREFFSTGIHAVDGYDKTRQCLLVDGKTLVVRDAFGHVLSKDLDFFRRIFLIGLGKVAGPMARAAEDILQDRITKGIIVVKHGSRVHLKRTDILEAAHPIPDVYSLKSAQMILRLAAGLNENDLMLCLLSGGGSALCSLPHGAITLPDLQQLTQELLSCGANINEINILRKHLSQIKGGQLARFAYPATVVSLIISDVIDDRVESIASGPTAPDPSTFKDAYDIIKKYHLLETAPVTIRAYLKAGLQGKVKDTPKPGEPFFKRTSNFIITHNLDALHAIAQKAAHTGYRTLILTSRLRGDTRHVAPKFGGLIKGLASSAHSQRAICVIAGGEMTVQVTGKGKGGRNCDFGLAVAPILHDLDRAVLLSAGTDGADGMTDAAGVIIDSTTLKRLEGMGLDHRAALADHDSYSIFKESGDLLVTGPTNTNVMDIQLALVA